MRSDTAVNLLRSLSHIPEESDPITSWMFDEVTSAASHSRPVELVFSLGIPLTSCLNSCAICGVCKTPGFCETRSKKRGEDGRTDKAQSGTVTRPSIR